MNEARETLIWLCESPVDGGDAVCVGPSVNQALGVLLGVGGMCDSGHAFSLLRTFSLFLAKTHTHTPTEQIQLNYGKRAFFTHPDILV